MLLLVFALDETLLLLLLLAALRLAKLILCQWSRSEKARRKTAAAYSFTRMSIWLSRCCAWSARSRISTSCSAILALSAAGFALLVADDIVDEKRKKRVG